MKTKQANKNAEYITPVNDLLCLEELQFLCSSTESGGFEDANLKDFEWA